MALAPVLSHVARLVFQRRVLSIPADEGWQGPHEQWTYRGASSGASVFGEQNE